MARYPIEILGKNPLELDKSDWQRNWCPFAEEECNKKNQVCTVTQSEIAVAICPNRFLENRLVFAEIALDYFGTTNDIFVLSEVYSGNRSLGKFDYVLVKHKHLSSVIEDFIIIEFQTVDTTATGKLNNAINDTKSGLDVTSRNYGFGLNWANVGKRSFIQMLNKGRVLEKWGHKAYWVFQEPTFTKLADAYSLESGIQGHTEGSTVFLICDLKQDANRLELYKSRIGSSTVEQLTNAFSTNPTVPQKSAFLQNLGDRIRSGRLFVL